MKNSSPSVSSKPSLPQHPFGWLSEINQRAVFFGSLLLTAALMVAIGATNAPLQNPAAPLGMISWQLAGSLEASQRIIVSWDAKAQISAALNLGLDYLYMCGYGSTLSLACIMFARRLGDRFQNLAKLGVWLSWGVMAALVLDAIENYLLIQLLFEDQRAILATLAWWCAMPKFALVLAALVYIIVGAIFAWTKPSIPAERS